MIYHNKNDIEGGFICYDDAKGEKGGYHKSALMQMKTIASLINENRDNMLMRGILFNSIVLRTKNTNAEIEQGMKKVTLESYQCPYFVEHELSEMNNEP